MGLSLRDVVAATWIHNPDASVTVPGGLALILQAEPSAIFTLPAQDRCLTHVQTLSRRRGYIIRMPLSQYQEALPSSYKPNPAPSSRFQSGTQDHCLTHVQTNEEGLFHYILQHTYNSHSIFLSPNSIFYFFLVVGL